MISEIFIFLCPIIYSDYIINFWLLILIFAMIILTRHPESWNINLTNIRFFNIATNFLVYFIVN